MALELDVQLSNRVSIEKLRSAARATMRRVLRVESLPELIFSCVSPERPVPSTLEPQREAALEIALASGEPLATIVVYQVPTSLAGPGQAAAVISVSGDSGPLSFALVACLACALAQMNGTRVLDEGRIWMDQESCTADEMEKRLRNPANSSDFVQAARDLVARLPVCASC